MLTIALTGGIGCGKTAVTEFFQELALNSEFEHSLKIIDADIIARELLAGSLNNSLNNPNKESALRQVQQLFGTEIFDAKGYLDRKKLRALIFSSKEKKQQLETLLHPMVYQQIFSQLRYKSPDIAIIAIPLLFETKSDYNFDRILVIDIPIELQIERSSARDNCSPDLIKKIVNSQVNRQTRLAQADDIIDNSGTLLELQQQVASLLKYYQSIA